MEVFFFTVMNLRTVTVFCLCVMMIFINIIYRQKCSADFVTFDIKSLKQQPMIPRNSARGVPPKGQVPYSSLWRARETCFIPNEYIANCDRPLSRILKKLDASIQKLMCIIMSVALMCTRVSLCLLLHSLSATQWFHFSTESKLRATAAHHLAWIPLAWLSNKPWPGSTFAAPAVLNATNHSVSEFCHECFNRPTWKYVDNNKIYRNEKRGKPR